MRSELLRALKLITLQYPEIHNELSESILSNDYIFALDLGKRLNATDIIIHYGKFYYLLPRHWMTVRYVYYEGKRYDLSDLQIPVYVPDLYYDTSDGRLYTVKIRKISNNSEISYKLSHKYTEYESDYFHPHGGIRSFLCNGDIGLDKFTDYDLRDINLGSIMTNNQLVNLLSSYIKIIDNSMKINVVNLSEWRVNE